MSDFISDMPGSAKTALANYLGVSLREVERWSSTAVQFRNFIPSRYWESEVDDLDSTQRLRYFVAVALVDGLHAVILGGGGRTGTYPAGTGSIATALQLAERYRFSQMNDEFRDNATIGITIIPVGSRWRVDIDWEVAYSTGGEWGERDWDDQLSEDFLE